MQRVKVFDQFHVHSVGFTLDGRHVWVTSRHSDSARLIDVDTGTLSIAPAGELSRHVCFTSDGSTWGTEVGKAFQVMDWRTQATRCQVPPPSLFGDTVEFSQDG